MSLVAEDCACGNEDGNYHSRLPAGDVEGHLDEWQKDVMNKIFDVPVQKAPMGFH